MKPLEEMGKFATVVVDPPWDMPPFGFNPDAPTGMTSDNPIPYAMMDLSALGDLPIEAVLADDAWAFCWTVNRFLPHTFHLLSRWGLTYSFTMTWVKNGGLQTPVSAQFNAEWIIVGRKGKPQWQETKAFKSANYWPRREHSEKPEGFYDLLRRVTPGPRLDIFGRRRIAGFESWGNEAPEGPALPDHYQQVLLA